MKFDIETTIRSGSHRAFLCSPTVKSRQQIHRNKCVCVYFKFQGGFKRPNPNPINYVLCAHYFNLCIAVGCNTTTTAVTTVTTAATIATTATITATVFTRGHGGGGGWSLFFGYHGAKFYSIASNFNYESQAFVGINAIAVITVAVVTIIIVVVVGGDVNESIIRGSGGSSILIFSSSM